MSRGIENLLAIGIEETASGASLAGRDHVLVAAVDIHHKDLIALHIAMRRLEDQFLAIGGKISFGILSTEGQLVHIVQMFFLWGGHIGRVRALRGCCLAASEVEDEQKEK